MFEKQTFIERNFHLVNTEKEKNVFIEETRLLFATLK